MKFTLGEIRKHTNQKPFTFDDYVDVSELLTMKTDIREINPVRVYGDCIQTGEQFVFSFRIKGEMVLPDARTLADVSYSFQIKAREIFTTSPHVSEEEEELEIHTVKGEVIDLTPYIKEHILLETPYRVYSDKESDDSSPMSGNGWELLSEGEKKSTVDPRFQKLQVLLDKKSEEK